MKDILIKLGFNEWLVTLEIAPYPVMFWDVPKFIQLIYIQKWFREVHNIHIFISSKTIKEDKIIYIPHGRTIPDTIKNKLVVDIIQYKSFDKYEEALEFALQESLKLIKDEK